MTQILDLSQGGIMAFSISYSFSPIMSCGPDLKVFMETCLREIRVELCVDAEWGVIKGLRGLWGDFLKFLARVSR